MTDVDSPSNDAEFVRARAAMPGGVSSPVRAFGSVGGTPRFIRSASGAYVTDVEGRQFVDLVAGWGAAPLGHAHPSVVRAVQEAAARGLSFGASTHTETELAEEIARRVSPVEKVRLVSTGTEATMTAIRLARGATDRDLVVKFAGHYHGHSDGLLAQAGSGLATLGLPASAGVPAAVAALTIVAPYNDLVAVRAVFAEYGERIAAVIMEAAPANMGVVPPHPGFNAAVTALAHDYGALVILDEVLTGFRVGPAGYWGIENTPGTADPYTPDLFTYGKVIGGGLPVGAIAGPASLLDLLAPSGPVYQAGTLSGNPVAVAAGLATLRLLDGAAYSHLDRVATVIGDAASAALTAAQVPHLLQRAGNLFSVAFGDAVVASAPDYAAVQRQDVFRYAPFFHSMLDAGVSLPPSVFEAWFVSTALKDAAVAVILDALPAAARAAEAAPRP